MVWCSLVRCCLLLVDMICSCLCMWLVRCCMDLVWVWVLCRVVVFWVLWVVRVCVLSDWLLFCSFCVSICWNWVRFCISFW